MSRTDKRVRLNRGGLTGEWTAVRVSPAGVVTDRWPLHEDDQAVLNDLWTARLRLDVLEAAAATHDLGRGECVCALCKPLRAVLSAAPTDTTKET